MYYVEQTLHIKVRSEPLKTTTGLPFVILDSYELSLVHIGNVKCIFAYAKQQENSIRAIKKHFELLQSKQSLPIVLVIKNLALRERNALIAAGIPFVQDGNQLYLPFMGAVLQERCRALQPKTDKLLPSAQMIVLYCIYNKKNVVYEKELTEKLGFTSMSISRAIKQLEACGLASTQKDGVRIVVTMCSDGEELFRNALPYLRSPVKKCAYAYKKDTGDTKLFAGITALSEYSMLNQPSLIEYVMEKLPASTDTVLFDTDTQCRVQLWTYDPSKFADGDKADVLSVALSLKDDADERVQGEIENALAGFWESYNDKRI